MRYLGGTSGHGVLQSKGEDIAQTFYDFDSFFQKPAGITSCGEIRMPITILEGVFGRKDLQLLTEDGRLLDLKFSEKALPPSSDVVHVDVTGNLPAAWYNWRRKRLFHQHAQPAVTDAQL